MASGTRWMRRSLACCCWWTQRCWAPCCWPPAWGSRLLGFDRADQITIVFCGSKKSLASGLPMASVLFAGKSVGLIVLPLMLFHQIQLMVCAALARRWAAVTRLPLAQPAPLQ